MKKILINGLSANSAGGKSVFVNLVRSLNKINSDNQYYLLSGMDTLNETGTSGAKNIVWLNIGSLHSIPYFMPYTYIVHLPNLIKKLEIDVVLNLADVPIKTNKTQILLFDWAYAVYPESIVWNRMSVTDNLYRKLKLWFFKKYLSYVDLLLAQSDVMKKRLHDIYGFKKIGIAPNAVSLDNLDSGSPKDFNLPGGPKFLYLTRFYPHKNLSIFLKIAQKIKDEQLDWKLIITLDREQSYATAEFLDKIEARGLDLILVNIGSVEMKHVPSLYNQCDYLLMPTLLESFSGTYVEAMYHKLPILTSDLDFAHAVCKDAALYFDPLDEDSIFDAMKNMMDNNLKKEFVEKGTDTLDNMTSWADTALIICNAVEEC